MLGVLVNGIAIIACTIFGLCIKKVMNERIESAVMQALGICVLVVGLIDAVNPVSGTTGILVVILSFVIGGMLGGALNIEKGFDKLGEMFEKGFNKVFYRKGKQNIVENQGRSNFAEGFIQATMVYCIGAMVVYGSLAAGLGDNKILYVKAVLDGTLAVILAVKYGIGVMFSAIPVMVIQGAIAGSASFIGEYLMSQTLFRQELSAIGGVFVMMIGINLLEIKKMHVANMLPAILGACYYLIF